MRLRRLSALALSLAATAAAAGSLPALPPAPPAGRPWTFAAMGDNRGARDGTLAPGFRAVLAGLNAAHPLFVLSSGDLVLGYDASEALRRTEMDVYRRAVLALGIPFFHAPGNHDIHDGHDEAGIRLWAEFWGPAHYAFDFGRARIIALDTETDHHRVAGDQFAWLARELDTARGRTVFVFFHEPLYPVSKHIGGSLDVFPKDRDALHALFVRHRREIGAVFEGHEHLYHSEVRDGVRYDIVGDGGAPLYEPPERGGFYGFELVTMTGTTPTFRVVRVTP